MKILGGKFKGRNFYMPKDIRPTSNVVRKAVFDILGADLSDINFLELFAGSGAIGIEAVSRGAGQVTIVERESKCVHVLEENLKLFTIDPYQYDGPLRLVRSDVFMAMKHFRTDQKKFDVVFLDPPYGRGPAPLSAGLAKKTLKNLVAHDILQPSALVFIEHEKREILPHIEGRFLLVRQRKYGTSVLSLYQGA